MGRYQDAVRDAFENRPGIRSVELEYVAWTPEHGAVDYFAWRTAKVTLVLGRSTDLRELATAIRRLGVTRIE